MPKLTVQIENWPIAGAFTISRGSRTQARVVVVTLEENGVVGRGECVPYARYNETAEGVAQTIDAMRNAVAQVLDRRALIHLLPAGAARNALDCALWDLQAKTKHVRAWVLSNMSQPQPMTTAYTLSLGSADDMEAAARNAAHYSLLKVKLGGEGDAARIGAVRRGAPNATLIVDANEAWRETNFLAHLEACRAADVKLIEQPLPAGQDAALEGVSVQDRGGILFCADESLHTAADLPGLASRYQAVNIKLDKTGGLTEAISLYKEARVQGFSIMVGCMVGTSLAMAPAVLLAGGADFVDLDGPLLLARDREPGLKYEGSLVYPPQAALWG